MKSSILHGARHREANELLVAELRPYVSVVDDNGESVGVGGAVC